jgi:hypothetical protein
MIRAFFVKTRFNWKDWRSYVAAVNRFFQRFWGNHCGLMILTKGTWYVSEYESDYALTELTEWRNKNLGRYEDYETLDISELCDYNWVLERVLNSRKEFKGYDYLMWLNYFFICLRLPFRIPNNPKRETCSEWLWYLLTKCKTNEKMPKNIYLYIKFKTE